MVAFLYACSELGNSYLGGSKASKEETQGW